MDYQRKMRNLIFVFVVFAILAVVCAIGGSKTAQITKQNIQHSQSNFQKVTDRLTNGN